MITPTPPRSGRRAGHAQVAEATVDRRYYDFRTQLRVVDTGDWLSGLEATGRAWLAEKRVELPEGIPAAFRGDGVEARIDSLTSTTNEAFRLTLAEDGDQGTWLTEILAVGRLGAGGRISVTVRNSESRFINRPRIVPRVLEQIEVLDGNSELVDDTWIVTLPHLREFLAVLSDPARNAPVFVTAARPGADVGRVQEWMAERSRELAGLAHSYVLDADSNAKVMQGLGRSMGIKPGSIRSFAPRPLAHDPEDTLRHRVIGALRLETLHPKAAAALVGRIARFEASSRPEAPELRDARRDFDRKVLDDRFRRRTTITAARPAGSLASPALTPAPSDPRVLRPETTTPENPPRTPGRVPETTSPSLPSRTPDRPTELAPTPAPSTAYPAGDAGVPSTLSEKPPLVDQDEDRRSGEAPVAPVSSPASPLAAPGVSPASAEEAVDRTELPVGPTPTADDEPDSAAPVAVPAGADLPAGTLALLERFTTLTGTTNLAEAIDAFQVMNQLYEEAGERAREDLQERERLADEAAEHELTAKALELELSGELSRRRTAEQNLRTLHVFSRSEEPGTERELHPAELPAPELFSDLPEAVRRLEAYVRFTGDPRRTAELDEYDHAGLGVKRCWEGIVALHDYARATVDSAHKGSFYDYLRATPDGFSTFPLSHYAATESESTMGKKEFALERTLKVPETVQPSGYVEMWAHLKLLKVGRISPRLHFHDDAAGTGKIYVGYIGRHLGISSN